MEDNKKVAEKTLELQYIQDYLNFLYSKFNNNLGNTYRKLKNPMEALKLYTSSLESVEKIKSFPLKNDQKLKASFNLGTLLFEIGNFLSGINILKDIQIKENLVMQKYLISKGYDYIIDSQQISEAVCDYFKKFYKSSIIKLKGDASQGSNPITNFFLALNYINLNKIDKAVCCLDMLFWLNKTLALEEKKLFRKIIKKATLIYDVIKRSSSELGDTYINDLVDFNDFENLSNLDKYDVEYEKSINNIINIDLNVISSNTDSHRFKGIFSFYFI